MATQKQKKVAKLIVENASLDKPLNGGEILEKTGYAPGVVKNPKDILESAGVQDELECLGFTEENAKKVVHQIMMSEESEEHNRLKAADMVFKVKGTYAPEKADITSKGDKIMTGESEIALLAKQAAEILKEHDTDSTRPSET